MTRTPNGCGMPDIVLRSSPYKVAENLAGPLYIKRICSVPCDCCPGNLLIRLEEARLILSNRPDILPYMRETVRDLRWFGDQIYVDDDQPDKAVSFLMRGYVQNGGNRRCVFVCDDGLCALHKLGVAKYGDWAKLKPTACCIYPLVIITGAVRLAEPKYLDGRWNIMGKCIARFDRPTPGVVLFEKELRVVLGSKGYVELLERVHD